MEKSFSILPLFPLQVVLLPGAVIPLHVFEERYKVLIHECMRDQKEFGINLVLGGRVHRVGCTAMLEEIIRRYPDGRMDVRVRGQKRYRLTEEYSAEDTPYFVGKVLFLPEEPVKIDPELTAQARKMLSEVLQRVYKGKEKPVFVIDQYKEISFQLAEYSGLDFSQRQELLECSNEQKRIQLLIDHYTLIIEKLTMANTYVTILNVDSSRLN
jgi:ATP-dependent Lon protease